MLETAFLALMVFASTNIDDAFVLLVFFADARLRPRDVVAGQYLGIAVLTAAALVFALLAVAIPDRYVGLMGVFPILIGLLRLWQAWRDRHAAAQASEDPPTQIGSVQIGPWGAAASVAAVTIANGGDNIAVYTPQFAHMPAARIALICAVFAMMVAVWCLAAQALTRHRHFGAVIQTWGKRITPFVLIALGGYIVWRGEVLAA